MRMGTTSRGEAPTGGGVEPPGIVLCGPHGHPSDAESHLVVDRGMSGSKRLNDLARSHMEETMVRG